MTSTLCPLDHLRRADYNPRRLSDEAFARLQARLRRHGVVASATRLARTHKYVVLLRVVQSLHHAGQAEDRPMGESLKPHAGCGDRAPRPTGPPSLTRWSRA